MKKIFLLCVLAMSLVSCSTGSRQESTGEYVDSSAITAKIKTAFVRNTNLSAMDIKVVTYKNVVQLSGFVDNDGQRQLAEKLAQEIEGVKEVKNDIRIRE